MIYSLKSLAKYALGLDQAGRNFPVSPDDTMVVSYPRSGNTWTRFLIANLLYPGEEVDFLSVERFVPDTTTISSRALKSTPRPRVIKTHEYFNPLYPKVIYIVRDPRDVVLSCYNFQRKYRQVQDGYPIERYVQDFLQGRSTERAWGTWGENVASWLSTRQMSMSFLLVRYEDLLSDTRVQLMRIGTFLKVPLTDQMVERAIRRSSADRMRELEKQQQDRWVGARKHRKDIPFVGTGKAGGWKSKLPESCVWEIEGAWPDLMLRLNYALAGDVSCRSLGNDVRSRLTV